MKNIKEYIETKTAIHCTTIEESALINQLIVENGGRSLHEKWILKRGDTCYGLFDIPYNTYGIEEDFLDEDDKYQILKASEFLQTKTNNTMKHIFKSGLVAEGSVRELKLIAKALGESLSPLYLSSTHGEIPVDEMHENHLKNAILLHARDFYTQKNFKGLNNTEFIVRFDMLDETTNMLLTELKSRI